MQAQPELNALQLASIKQQLDQEIELLATSIQSLQAARSKFEESEDCIKKQKEISSNTDILVPFTSSMYVSGKVKDPNKFIVDIGAGYYVEKKPADAIDYFQRKVKFLTDQVEKYTRLLQEKVAMRDSTFSMLQRLR